MAVGRGRVEWERVASLAVDIREGLTGERRDPMELIPDVYRPPKPPERVLTPEERAARDAAENRGAWAMLDGFFKGRG